jgi:hypothetical protein
MMHFNILLTELHHSLYLAMAQFSSLFGKNSSNLAFVLYESCMNYRIHNEERGRHTNSDWHEMDGKEEEKGY